MVERSKKQSLTTISNTHQDHFQIGNLLKSLPLD